MSSNRKRSVFKWASGLSFALLVSTAAFSNSLSANASGRYITQQQIEESGGYEMVVPRLGRFTVVSASPGRDVPASLRNCRVSINSLGQLLREEHARNGLTNGVLVPVYLERHVGTNSEGKEVLFCEGGGDDCVTHIEVDELFVRDL